ncbi:PolC-type DNA polymerase III [Flavobacterium sp. H122]|uniref:3'-5' exonuclease n=1 Tax=Flavobacterium sp. H122 TaxID=2529860 RepID=UPI0010AA2560|nr:exonuclease domain-containing protein [Flavobacterium sp. H122]
MLDWFKNLGKDYPEFWRNYLIQQEIPSVRKVALHIETTGINPVKDKILSIGAISIENNQIMIENSLEIDLDKSKKTDAKQLTYEEVQAIESLINFIGNATLIGHRIHYDIEIINQYLSRLQSGRIKNNSLDVEVMQSRILDQTSKKYSLEELLVFYKIKNPEIHTSGNLAYNVALLFLKMRNKLGL